MLESTDLIVFSDDWGIHPFSCQHIIKRFLDNNRVIWVNTIGYRSIKLNKYDIKRAYNKIMNWTTSGSSRYEESTNNPKPTILNPVCIPFGKIPLVRRFNTFSVSGLVNKFSAHLNFHNPIVITTLPTSSDFIGNLGERLAVYYCVDDFTQWPGVHGELMREMENQLLNKVDLVIATSEKLCNTRKNESHETKLLTHGVDIEHFSSKPEAVSLGVKKPIVAYFGLIDERCDLELLKFLALNMSAVSFLIIGQFRVDPKALKDLPNVHIIGPVKYSDLPSYIMNASVLILPYVLNELSDSINPLKLKEYIATGLPIVSTPLPEVVKLQRFVNIANTYDSFKQQVAINLETGKRDNSELNAFLKENSWEQKAEEFSLFVKEVLIEKKFTD